MSNILYICHRIPYPPNKGDKIRSWHVLKYMARNHDIHLAAFIDDPNDRRYQDEVASFCKSVFFREIRPAIRRITSLRGILSGEALSLIYFRDKSLQDWIDDRLDTQDISHAVCFSSVMSQYVMGDRCSNLVRIADFVDMDSDKWKQYSLKKSFPMRWIYSRESDKLFSFEKRAAEVFDACLFVSESEAGLFARKVPWLQNKVGYFNNGVDAQYFNPDNQYVNPFEPGSSNIVFTGAMDYWANIDAVSWFVHEIMPMIRKNSSGARFYIIGSNPSQEVSGLANSEDIFVTGKVPDVRPFLAHANLVVVPLRIARGIQNKVLEAMAMGKQLVLTNPALEGFENKKLFQGRVSDDAGNFARACLQYLKDENNNWSHVARSYVEAEYSWVRNLSRFEQYM